MKRKSAIVLFLISVSAAPAVRAQQAPATPANIVTADDIWHGKGSLLLPTLREECRSMVLDSLGRMWTVGIQSDGSETLNATRQFLSIGRVEGAYWRTVAQVTPNGHVYFPSAAPDRNGGLWLAWSEFDETARIWRVHTAYFDGAHWSKSSVLDNGSGPELRTAIAVEADGQPLIVFEAAEGQRFVLRAAKYNGERWNSETLTTTEYNFRPALAVDRSGTTWLAWDRFADGYYDTLVESRSHGVWGKEVLFLAGTQDEQFQRIQFDPAGTLWILAGGRLAGIRANQRVELATPPKDPPDDFMIDSGGRFWFFRSLWKFSGSMDYLPRRGAEMLVTVDGGRAPYNQAFQMALGYNAPVLDQQADLWNVADSIIYRVHGLLPAPEQGAPAVRYVDRLEESRQPVAPPARLPDVAPSTYPEFVKNPTPIVRPSHLPHRTVQVGGETYTLFFCDMHVHLGEFPSSRTIEAWPDRFYLKAAWSGILDAASVSDHDWHWMTVSKYWVEQAYASVLSIPNEFQALSGYEWSGDDYVRRRFGDRTIVFPQDYMPIFRITDPESSTPQKLHAKLQPIGAIDWPHHIGASFAVMDWSTYDGAMEPVSEIVSLHGVFETYDPATEVPVKFENAPITDKTSIQYALGQGKRIGFVGSSDSHSGLSAFPLGMFGIYAKSLTRDSLLEALRSRRTIAIRGGEPIMVDVRVNGAFMGEEIKSNTPPRLSVRVQAQSPIEKVEIIRDGNYVYEQAGEGKEANFKYQDMKLGKYYYVRVWLVGGKYAWSSPVFIN